MTQTRATLLIVTIAMLWVLPRVVTAYTPNTWLAPASLPYVDIQRQLLEHGTVDLRGSEPPEWYGPEGRVDMVWSRVALGTGGEWWPKQSLVMPIVALPFYWAFGTPGTLLFNLLVFALLAGLTFRLAATWTGPLPAAAASLVVLLLAPVSDYTYGFVNQLFVAMLIVAALLALRTRRGATGGLLWGLAVWAHPGALFTAPAVIALAWELDRSGRLRLLVGGGVVAIALGVTNTLMFGAPWITSYHRVLTVENGVPGMGNHVDFFSRPLGAGLGAMLLDRRSGLLLTNPLIVLGWLAALAVPWRAPSRRTTAGISAAIVLSVLAYARYEQFTIRLVFPAVALTAIPLAMLVSSLIGWLERLRVPPLGPRRLLAAGGASLLIVLLVGRLTSDTPASIWPDHFARATVSVGDQPCRWYDERRLVWSCGPSPMHMESAAQVGLDTTGRHTLGGRAARGFLVFGGRDALPDPLRWVATEVPIAETTTLRYALADGAAGPHRLEVRLAGQLVFETTVTPTGTLTTETLDTSAFTAQPVEVDVRVVPPPEGAGALLLDARPAP